MIITSGNVFYKQQLQVIPAVIAEPVRATQRHSVARAEGGWTDRSGRLDPRREAQGRQGRHRGR